MTRSRVILLLDLDCFYAQCESVRLGLDPSVPLCLLQWNSALAVNYPARNLFDLKRGAKFEEIQLKSKGQCIALHLPVVSTADIEKQMDEDIEENSTDNAYHREFNKPKDEKRDLFLKEKNVMKHSGMGKASLDRYRLASTKIFEVMLKALNEFVGKGNFILEKASIDELFLDVTKHCYDDSVPAWKFEDANETVILEETTQKETFIYNNDFSVIHERLNSDTEYKALWRGAIIARGLRKVVFEELGFTLSAGISTSKLVSKLSASLGKPNGQSITFIDDIPNFLEKTKIRKARHLGGALGKKVLNLLPANEETMGSICRILTLNQLVTALGNDAGRQVWNFARGIDDEEVRETKRALTKSITAFKSFTIRSVEDVPKWIKLLAADLFARVKNDCIRNNRFPTICNIQYYYRDDVKKDRIGKSVRIPFPKQYNTSDQDKFIAKVKSTLETKIDVMRIVRLGLCAIGFHDLAKNDIGTFFRQASPKIKSEKSKTTTLIESSSQEQTQVFQFSGSEDISIRKLHMPTCPENQAKLPGIGNVKKKSNAIEDADLKLAKELQRRFDRENQVLTSLESKKKKMKTSKSQYKNSGIDSFFTKKKSK